MTKKTLERITALTIFLFFNHGILYIYYDSTLDSNYWMKLIKYVLVLAVLSLTFLSFFNKPRFNLKCAITFTGVVFLILSSVLLSIQYGYLTIFLFFFPILFFNIYKILSIEKFLFILKVTLVICVFVAIIEWLFLYEISSRFHSLGFRSISTFINPNAHGVFVVLLLGLIVFEQSPLSQRIFFYGLGIVSILLSGSMTALAGGGAITVLACINLLRSKRGVKYVFTGILIIGILAPLYIYYIKDTAGTGLREFTWVSMTARFEYISQFITAMSVCPIMPKACNAELYADNAFLYAWINLGLFGAIFFIVVAIIPIANAFIKSTPLNFFAFFGLFFISSLTLNVFNIWPTSYIFWIVSGYYYSSVYKISRPNSG